MTDAVAVTCQLPTILARQHAALVPAFVVDRRTEQFRLLIYTTTNDGRSWQSHPVPVGGGLEGYVHHAEAVAFSAPNARDLFVFVRPYLYTSTNGGRTWSRTAHRQLGDVQSLDFISPTYGWLNAGLGTGRELFDYTTDGGRSWKPMGSRRLGARTG